MNNKGQSLVVFIILLPLIITFAGFFIEKGNLMYQENKIGNVLELSCLEKDKEEFIKENIGSIKIDIDLTSKTITANTKVKPVIAGSFGFKDFKISKKIKCKEWNNG